MGELNTLRRPWLLLAFASIGLSALFAILLVVARTPLLQQLFGGADLFHTVLVLHVNFSVLVWLLAFGALLWSLELPRLHPLFDPLAFILVIIGALLISLSPLLTPPPQPVMSNYIPILYSPAFLTGLSALAAGVGIYALRRLFVTGDTSGRLAAVALLLALLVFAVSAWRLPHPIDSAAGFESLFWGGGHMLQFVYLLLLLACWQRLLVQVVLFGPVLAALTLALLLGGVALALLFEPGTASYHEAYTWLMRLGTPVIALPPLLRVWRSKPQLGLILSVLLLSAGLLLGAVIRGDTVSVTAHYHATNAAITLAFMALAYRLAVELELGLPDARLARRQLQLYFAGMTLYISGMALSGQLDVPRKVAMITEGLQALAMGLMGVGGLIAIAATLMFIAVQLHGVRSMSSMPQYHGDEHETTT